MYFIVIEIDSEYVGGEADWIENRRVAGVFTNEAAAKAAAKTLRGTTDIETVAELDKLYEF